jgi:hypothetical protein
VDSKTRKVPERAANVQLQIRPDGAVICGEKKFLPKDDTIRGQILRLMGRDDDGVLSRTSYRMELIMPFIPPRERVPGANPILGYGFHRRQNNVDKAISRLRLDLNRFFGDLVPEGTSWLYFSKKIDGWLLYRLPGLGSDGGFHW